MGTIPVGLEPRAEVYNPANGYVYVANFESGTVSILGPSFSRTVTVGSYPIALAYDSATGNVYVANWASLNVSLIYELSGNFFVDFLGVGSRPDALAYDSANGYIYAANENSNNVTVLSGANGSLIANIPVGLDPKAVVYSPVYDRVYVANTGSDTVSVIQGTRLETTVTVGTAPVAFAYDPLFLFAPTYVANSGSHNLSVLVGPLSIAGPQVGINPTALTIDSSNGNVYVANSGSGNVSIITLSGAMASVPVGGGPDALTYDSGNGFVYVANSGSNDVSVILGTSLVLATVPVCGIDPVALAYDNATGNVYAANYQSSSVSVISETDVVGSVPAGTNPIALAYDSGNGYVYVANPGSLTISVLSGMTAVATVNVPAQPIALAYDAYNGHVYVGQWNTTGGYNPGLVSAINGTHRVPGPATDVGLVTGLALAVDDSNGFLYVADQDFFAFRPGNVSVISGTRLLGNVTVGYDPVALAYDGGNGDIYVANLADNHLSVIRGTNVSGNVSNVLNAVALAYDSRNGCVYVADYYQGITVVSCGVVTRIATQMYPHHLLYDGVNGYLYAANIYSNSVTVISGNASLGNISVGTRPVALTDDIRSGFVYVSNAASYDISVISGATILGTIPIGITPYASSPGAEAYNPDNGYVYVATFPDTVSVIGIAPLSAYSFTASPSTIPLGGNTTLQVRTSGGTGYLVYSYSALPPGCASQNISTLACTPTAAGRYTVTVVVAEAPCIGTPFTVTATAALIVLAPPGYPVRFAESGLPPGTNWSVTLSGSTKYSTSSSVSFVEPNGTYSFSVGFVPGYTATPASGTVAVMGSPQTVAVSFEKIPRGSYTVTFAETGLPTGTNWSVILNGTAGTSTGTRIVFTEPNGTYGFTVGAVPGFESRPGSGAIPLSGSPVTEAITFEAIPLANYTVTFTESGLPVGVAWSVTLAGVAGTSTGSSLVFTEPNGTYAFSVGSGAGYTAKPASGTVTVTGAAKTVAVSFVAIPRGSYVVTFTETGLPLGTNWSVTLNGTTHSSTGNVLLFTEPNGSYSFAVGAVAGYTATPLSGSVTVSGTGVAQTVAFASGSVGNVSTIFGLPPAEAYALIGGIVAAIAIAAVVLGVWYRRRKRPGQPASVESPPTPSGSGPPPPPGAQ